jgi:hypothetical protein
MKETSRVKGRGFLVALAVLAGCGAVDAEDEHGPIASSDVTFLLPLGTGLGATSKGGHGPLLPRAHFDALEPLTRTDEPDALYANLEVVGVRLDPCFVEGGGGTPCASQVRLVLQPVFSVDGLATTRDAAMHAFYAVPLAELHDLAHALAELRAESGGSLEVGVHVAADRAVAVLLPHLGADRLTRLTAMSVHPSGEAWFFSGVDISPAGVASEIVIPGVGEAEQHLTSEGREATLDATILPEPTIEPALGPFLEAARRDELDEAQRATGLATVESLLDPASHDPGTVDCASCHVATTALRFATRASEPSRVPSAYDDTTNQRMFGYFGSVPSISPRVNAETRAVLEWLERSE